jgi:hypothetical protein
MVNKRSKIPPAVDAWLRPHLKVLSSYGVKWRVRSVQGKIGGWEWVVGLEATYKDWGLTGFAQHATDRQRLDMWRFGEPETLYYLDTKLGTFHDAFADMAFGLRETL